MGIKKTQLRLKDLKRVRKYLVDIGYNIDDMTIDNAIERLTEQIMYGVAILSAPPTMSAIDIDRLVERMTNAKWTEKKEK